MLRAPPTAMRATQVARGLATGAAVVELGREATNPRDLIEDGQLSFRRLRLAGVDEFQEERFVGVLDPDNGGVVRGWGVASVEHYEIGRPVQRCVDLLDVLGDADFRYQARHPIFEFLIGLEFDEGQLVLRGFKIEEMGGQRVPVLQVYVLLLG